MHYSSILPDVIKVADAASEKVLHIYESNFKVEYKEDQSPITAADVASHEVIVQGLRSISRDIPHPFRRGEKHSLGRASTLAPLLAHRSD